jgi:hypothetical protein
VATFTEWRGDYFEGRHRTDVVKPKRTKQQEKNIRLLFEELQVIEAKKKLLKNRGDEDLIKGLPMLDEFLKDISGNWEDILDGHKFRLLLSYLDLDLWTEKEGLLLLSGVYPTGAVVNFNERTKRVNINNADILGARVFTSEYPDCDSTRNTYWLLSRKVDQAEAEGASTEKVAKLKANLDEFESSFMCPLTKGVWTVIGTYSAICSNIYRLWLGSNHMIGKQPKEYFINWALERGLEISWLDWAQEQGYFTDIETPTTQSSGITSKYLIDLQNRINHLEKKFPLWKETQGTIQNAGNLQDWIKAETGSDTREVELIKKALIEIFPELKRR